MNWKLLLVSAAIFLISFMALALGIFFKRKSVRPSCQAKKELLGKCDSCSCKDKSVI